MKLHKLAFIMLSVFGLAACNVHEPTEEEKLYQKIWEGNTIYNEPVVMIEHEDGYYGQLLYEPTKILSVKNYTLESDYSETDYRIEGRRVYRTENSTFPYLTRDNINCVTLPEGIGTYSDGGDGKILFTETPGLIAYQVMVTYEHNGKWEGTVPQKRGNELPRLQQRLANKEDIKLVVFGDSIFTGASASGRLGIPPHQDIFPIAFTKEIERVYGSKIEYTNTSVGGEIASWGASTVNDRVIPYDPDLVIVGFGMNDGCGGIPVDEYIGNIRTIVETIQEKNKNADIIICGSILANPDSHYNRTHRQYVPELNKLASEKENVTVLDMTTFSDDILKYKSSFEFFVNNINHPDDFVVRSYVANLMHLIQKA